MPVLYQNAQWSVTDLGLDSVTPGAPYVYEIDAELLLHDGDYAKGLYNVPFQVGDKTWADLNLLEDAYRRALVIHADKYQGHVDQEKLTRSFATARKYRD